MKVRSACLLMCLLAVCIIMGFQLSESEQPRAVLAESQPIPDQQECRIFTSSGDPITIPDDDPAGITSTITIPPLGYLVSFSLSMNIEHSYPADIYAELHRSDFCYARIFDDRQLSSQEYIGSLEFSNNGVHAIDREDYPYADTYIPNRPFESSISAGGKWSLHIADTSGGDEGKLNSWSVTVCSAAARPTKTPTVTRTSTLSVTATSTATTTPLPRNSCAYIFTRDRVDGVYQPSEVPWDCMAVSQTREADPSAFATRFAGTEYREAYTQTHPFGALTSDIEHDFLICTLPYYYAQVKTKSSWESERPGEYYVTYPDPPATPVPMVQGWHGCGCYDGATNKYLWCPDWFAKQTPVPQEPYPWQPSNFEVSSWTTLWMPGLQPHQGLGLWSSSTCDEPYNRPQVGGCGFDIPYPYDGWQYGGFIARRYSLRKEDSTFWTKYTTGYYPLNEAAYNFKAYKNPAPPSTGADPWNGASCITNDLKDKYDASVEIVACAITPTPIPATPTPRPTAALTCNRRPGASWFIW